MTEVPMGARHKDVHYPYNPKAGNYGWTEGWVQFNTAYNLSLAYLARAETELELEQAGDELVVRLRAPLNFDIGTAEPITLELHGAQSATVQLSEASPDSPGYIGRISIDALGSRGSDTITAAYGFGYMATKARLKLQE